MLGAGRNALITTIAFLNWLVSRTNVKIRVSVPAVRMRSVMCTITFQSAVVPLVCPGTHSFSVLRSKLLLRSTRVRHHRVDPIASAEKSTVRLYVRA